MNELYSMVYKCQNGNKESLMKIIFKFKPLIKKYARKLKFEDSTSELVSALIETVFFLPIHSKEYLKRDECIVGYINMSIKNKYINLSKKYCKISNMELELNEDISIKCNKDTYAITDNKIFINELLNELTVLQKEIIIKKFFEDYKDNDIATQLGISRQAVNRIKNRALKKCECNAI